MKNNITSLTKLTIPWTITRWDAWRRSSHFLLALEQVKEKYEGNLQFKHAFDKNTDQYLERLKKNGKELVVDDETATHFVVITSLRNVPSCFYGREKVINLNCMLVEEIYPRKLLMKDFIKPLHPELPIPLSLQFKSTSLRLEVNKLEIDDETRSCASF